CHFRCGGSSEPNNIKRRILVLALSLWSWTAPQFSASSILRFCPINNFSTSRMQKQAIEPQTCSTCSPRRAQWRKPHPRGRKNLRRETHNRERCTSEIGTLRRKAMSAQIREAVKPSHARPAATTHATQLAQKGIVVSTMVIGQPASARTNWRSATSEKITAARRE